MPICFAIDQTTTRALGMHPKPRKSTWPWEFLRPQMQPHEYEASNLILQTDSSGEFNCTQSGSGG